MKILYGVMSIFLCMACGASASDNGSAMPLPEDVHVPLPAWRQKLQENDAAHTAFMHMSHDAQRQIAEHIEAIEAYREMLGVMRDYFTEIARSLVKDPQKALQPSRIKTIAEGLRAQRSVVEESLAIVRTLREQVVPGLDARAFKEFFSQYVMRLEKEAYIVSSLIHHDFVQLYHDAQKEIAPHKEGENDEKRD